MIYIETSFILNIIFKTEKTDLAEQLLKEHQGSFPVTSGITVNETLYIATYEHYKKEGSSTFNPLLVIQII